MYQRLACWMMIGIVTGAALGQQQDRERRRGPRPPRGPSMDNLVQELTERIGLDEDQLVRLEEVLAAHQEARQQMRQMFREMRTARETGDEARVEELRAVLRQRRGEGTPMQGFLAEVEAVLREDQRDEFQAFRDELRERRPRRRGGPRAMMRELAENLELTETQREQARELLRAQRAQRNLDGPGQGPAGPGRRGGRFARRGPDRGPFNEAFFEQLKEVLTEEQAARLDDFRAEMKTKHMRRREGSEIRAMLDAVRRVDGLDEEQQRALRSLHRELRKGRGPKAEDGTQDPLSAAEVKTLMLELLNDDQAAQFETELAAGKSRRPGGDPQARRGPRGPRPPRPDRGAERFPFPGER